MQFQVPQFIEVEDKIFGQLTLKQFIYLAGGIGMCAFLYVFISIKFLAIILMLPVVAFALSLTFIKVNGKPFIDFIESGFYYLLGSKLYTWKKSEKKPVSTPVEEAKKIGNILQVPKLSESKLKDLTWSLDIKESFNSQEKK